MIIPERICSAAGPEPLAFLQSLFKNCPESYSSLLMMNQYPENYTLIHADDPCAHVSILLKGRLQATEEQMANGPFCFTELSAVDIVGDFELFSNRSSRMATLTTLEKSLCLTLPAADYLAWIRTDANALFLRTQMLVGQLSRQSRLERANLFLDNRKRLISFLYQECMRQAQAPYLIRYTHAELAGRLGCSVRTINRTIPALCREDFVSLVRGKMQISRRQFERLQACLNDGSPPTVP